MKSCDVIQKGYLIFPLSNLPLFTVPKGGLVSSLLDRLLLKGWIFHFYDECTKMKANGQR